MCNDDDCWGHGEDDAVVGVVLMMHPAQQP